MAKNMEKKTIATFLVATTIASFVTYGIFVPSKKPAEAFSFISIVTIAKKVIDILKKVQRVKEDTSLLSPFGGKITSGGVACKLHYWVATMCGPFPCTFPGVPIPLFGRKIDVGPPGLPIAEAFTLPYISKIYGGNNLSSGHWTLGQTLNQRGTKLVLDPLKSAVRNTSPITVGAVTLYNFSLGCPAGGVILKVGTD